MPEPGDKLAAVPFYALPANIAERGVFTRLKIKPVTALVNASSGAAEIIEEEIVPAEYSGLPAGIKTAPVKLSRAEAEGAAVAAASASSPRGWKRGLCRTDIFLISAERDALALRLYIIRGPQLIDSFTGESGEAASLIEFLI